MSNFFTNGENNKNNFFSEKNEGNFLSVDSNDNKPRSMSEQYNDLKNNYEEIFIEAAESIRRELDTFKPENPCAVCNIKDCKIEKKDIFASYPPNCVYHSWQLKAITYLAGDYRQKLKAEYKAIMDKKSEYSCSCCGACCKLAASEYSYEQLKQRAMRGDKFSADFISVFVPYEREEDAKQVNPEYFDMLNILVGDEKVYFYHCPKVVNNLCSIYDNRPDICKDFPHNPLKLLPSSCSYNAWKDAVSHQAMLLKAKTDIINFYKEKLQ